ncbi:hypothetical protein TNCV_2487001 [Trichonephila clavipes]|uniref:Uncharacterized protein n=1 Tax=Trichonephila clavipes TaxID=2585209 RepID=A0A8X6VZU3_TRICX|nr:hypothetical protein TNCV_2487001 [Trichonephila clavipes]
MSPSSEWHSSPLAQVDGFSLCRKSAASMSYDYADCKRSLQYLFGLGALAKIKFLSKISHRQSLRTSLPLWRKESIKITCGD